MHRHQKRIADQQSPFSYGRRAAPPAPRVIGSVATYFQQPCPTCGRRLLIRVEHLGQRLGCGHCGCSFVARDGCQCRRAEIEAGHAMLERANRLLARLESPGPKREFCQV